MLAKEARSMGTNIKTTYVERFRKELQEFVEMTEKFYRKEIDVPEYKAFSGGFGSYAQRGGERSMLRLRLAGGEINKENLEFIAESVRNYKIGLTHLTTCQTVQLHDLTKEDVCKLVEEAWEHGIITRGGGGDFPRNVMCTPLSGVRKGESFDVLPYAKEAADYLLDFIGKVKLPRKLKVGFSNSRENETHVTFRDLGFVAKEDHKFDVYAAGGLGMNPKLGVLVAEGVEPADVLYCIKTMVEVFTEYGNYENRARSRTRYLQDTLGAEELKRIFQEKLQKNLEQGDLRLPVSDDTEIEKGSVEPATADFSKTSGSSRVIAQKQPGLYAVSYHPVGGDVSPDFWQNIYELTKDMQDVKIRLTPTQGMYIINLTAEEASKVLSATADGAETTFERSTACIGAAICQQGIGLSQALLKECVDRVRKENFADGVLPGIHISGCPSSCSAHQTAVIGLRGGKKKSEEGMKDAFTIYENGCETEGKERFGEELGVMFAEEIPEFFVELGQAVQSEGLTYMEFREKFPERVREIAKNYV